MPIPCMLCGASSQVLCTCIKPYKPATTKLNDAKCIKCKKHHHFDDPQLTTHEDGTQYLQAVFLCCGKKQTVSKKIK